VGPLNLIIYHVTIYLKLKNFPECSDHNQTLNDCLKFEINHQKYFLEQRLQDVARGEMKERRIKQ